MAIVQKQQPPPSGPRVIGRALRDLRGPPDTRALLGSASINLSAPLPFYRLGLDQIDGSDFLKNAMQVGWRYLIEGGTGGADGGVAYADVKETGGGDSKFTSLSHNENAERLMQAAHLAQSVAADITGDCEARILDVPAVYVSTIWLSCATPVFIPYIYPPGFRSNEIEVQSNFLEQLQKFAEAARKHLNPGNASPG